MCVYIYEYTYSYVYIISIIIIHINILKEYDSFSLGKKSKIKYEILFGNSRTGASVMNILGNLRYSNHTPKSNSEYDFCYLISFLGQYTVSLCLKYITQIILCAGAYSVG